MSIKIEKEQRWILKTHPDLNKFEPSDNYFINQFYGEDDLGTFRLRERWKCQPDSLKERVTIGITPELFLTRKKKISFDSCEETEIAISYKEFDKYKSFCKKVIVKRRIIYSLINDLKAEIDIYFGLNLVLMEVELDGNKAIIFPSHIKELIIKEITGEEEFSNYNLASSW